MYFMFDENLDYTMPTGVVKNGKELIESGNYPILSLENAVVYLSGSILTGVGTLETEAERYGIDYRLYDNSEDLIEILNSKALEVQKPKTSTDNKIMAASARVSQIMAMSFTDEQALEVKDIYPEYQVDHAYKQGDFFTHEGELYKVNQAHTSASQWEPGSVGTESLYTHLTLNEDGYPIWKQPTGAHDAYNKGDIVEYNGELYKSLIDGNAYSPDTYPAGWEKYTEPTE